MKKIKLIRCIIIICIIIWAVFVFNLSNQQGEESSGLSRKITSIFILDESKIDIVEPYIRKIAHFSEYAFGGMLFMALFYTYEWTDRKKIIISSLIGIWYAGLDEFHQLFIQDRSGNIKDVGIDSIGIVFGVCVMLLIIKIFLIIRNGEKIND